MDLNIERGADCRDLHCKKQIVTSGEYFSHAYINAIFSI